jgi:sulfur relay (sulfurtransferase) complex TusBCD TusD component (DsrE family)
MSNVAKKLGVLLSTAPGTPDFRRGLDAAEAGVNAGERVFIYVIDDAVFGLADARLQSLRSRGAVLYACAYGAQRRGIPVNDLAVFGGLGLLGDLLAGTDEFFDGSREERK